jgi:hypothetical protein
MEDPGSGNSGAADDTLVSNTCPSCRTPFLAENYFVLQSAEPLTLQLKTIFRNSM